MTTSFCMLGTSAPGPWRGTLNQVGEGSLHFPELANSKPEQQHHHRDADADARPVDTAAKDAPAKRVDDSDQRIQRVQQTPFLRHDARTESDWRDVEAELNQKWNHIAKVAIF